MSTEPPVEAQVTTPEAAETFAPQPGIGVPLAVGTFGFSVLVLGLPTSRIISPDALGIFVPVAFGTGALGLFIGGLWEYRATELRGSW
jgi:succinate-acetate transporter protein